MSHEGYSQNDGGQSGFLLPYSQWESDRNTRQTRLLLDLDDREVFDVARAYHDPVAVDIGEPTVIRSYVMDIEGAFCSFDFTDRGHASFFILRGSLFIDTELHQLDDRDKDFAKFMMASLTREVPEELTASRDTTFYGVRDKIVDGAYLALHMAFPVETIDEAIETRSLDPKTMVHRHYGNSDFYVDPKVVFISNRVTL